MDLFITRSRSGSDATPLVFGVSASLDGAGATDLSCPLSASGRCLQAYPSTVSLAALAGWQNTRSWLRVFAGPALAHVEQATLGVAGRIDLALPVTSNLAITANARGMLFPSVRSEMYQIASFGFGMRFVQRRQ